MIFEDVGQYHLFAVYDKKYERFLKPMAFDDVKGAFIEIERSIKAAKERGEVDRFYLDSIEVRYIGIMDPLTGNLAMPHKEESITIEPKVYLED